MLTNHIEIHWNEIKKKVKENKKEDCRYSSVPSENNNFSKFSLVIRNETHKNYSTIIMKEMYQVHVTYITMYY